MPEINNRQVDHEIDPIFPNRWSPRAMSGESLGGEELMQLFEAARWAPSSFNSQPWRVLYAKKGTEYWDIFYNLLMEQNKHWAKNAGVLLVVISRDTFEYNNKPSRTHSFDTGAAWVSLALQASIMGLVAHGMSGFDYDKAKEELKIPDGYTVEAMVALGKPGKKEDLSEELQKMEVQSDRKKVEDFSAEGPFKW